MRRRHALAVLFGCAALGAARASADDLVVLDAYDGLIYVSQDTGLASVTQAIVGLDPFDHVRAVAKRPQNGVLYALGNNRLYSVDAATGQATVVGPRYVRARSFFQDVGFDFDVVRDIGRIARPTYDGGNPARTFDERIDAAGGGLDPGIQTKFAYAAGDVAEGVAPNLTSIAYASGEGVSPWTLYGIDGSRSALVRLGTAGGVQRDGDDVDVVTTLAPITGVAGASGARGLEIAADGRAFVVGQVGPGSSASAVFSLDLETGVATQFAQLGGFSSAVDLAAFPTAVLPASQELVVTAAAMRFDFRRARKADLVEISGVLPLPAEGWKGKKVLVDLGDELHAFVLDRAGRARVGGRTFQVATSGPVGGGAAFKLRLRKGRFLRQAVPLTTSGPLDFPMDVYVDGLARRTTLRLAFERKARTGAAHLRGE